MKIVKFTGSTPYESTAYTYYLAFEDNVSEQELKEQSKLLAIENAHKCDVLFDTDLDNKKLLDVEFNEKYQDYISHSIDNARWQFISIEEFNAMRAIDPVTGADLKN